MTPTEYRSEAAVTACSLRLLGREILGGAHDRAREGHVGGACAGDPEVGDPSAPLLVENHVVGLQIAVDHPPFVREPRGSQDLHDDVDRGGRIERALLAHDLLQRAAGHVLHRDVVRAVPLAAVEDRRRCSGGTVPPRSMPRGGSARRTPGPRRSDDAAPSRRPACPGAGPRRGTRRPCPPSRGGRSPCSDRR